MTKTNLKQSETKNKDVKLQLGTDEKKTLEKSVNTLTKTLPKHFVVNSDETRELASSMLKKISDEKKELKAKYDSIVDPINSALKIIKNEFTLIVEPLNTMDKQIREAMLEDIKRQKEKEAEERRKADEIIKAEQEKLRKELQSKNSLIKEQAEAKLEKVILKAENKITTANTRTTGTTVKTFWTYEITDFSQVPDEFKEINAGAVRRAMSDRKENGEPKEITGIRFYKDDTLALK